VYGNEEEVGQALRESGLAREDVYITTKYWGVGGLDIGESIHDSLKKVRLCLRSLYTATTEITYTRTIYLIWSTDGGVMLARALCTSPYTYSSASNTWICTSSTTRVLRGQTSRRRGPRWKPSSKQVLPSEFVFAGGGTRSGALVIYLGQWLTRLSSRRSIGVSNFGVDDLAVLLASAKIKPAANQVRFPHHMGAGESWAVGRNWLRPG
jgi:hypothetical protein